MSVDSDIGPFAIVPEWILRGVSPQALALFAELALHADRKTAKAWPSRARLAERLNVTTKTIDRSLKELVDIGAVEKHHRRDDSGWHSSLYLVKYVSPPSVAESPTPSPRDVPQNQNHFEPEPRTREPKPPASGMSENQILADTLLDEHSTAQYLIGRLDDPWQEALTPARLMKLGMEFGGSVVLDALRDLRESEPAAEDHYAYLRGICQSLRSGEAARASA